MIIVKKYCHLYHILSFNYQIIPFLQLTDFNFGNII
jgi:hypothetical protein